MSCVLIVAKAYSLISSPTSSGTATIANGVVVRSVLDCHGSLAVSGARLRPGTTDAETDEREPALGAR